MTTGILVLVVLVTATASAFVPRTTYGSYSSSLEASSASGSLGTGAGWIDPSAPVNTEASLRKTLEKSLEGSEFQKRLSILGSTGSIGTQTLQIVDACPNNFVVDALSAGNNAKIMAEQVLKYRPKIASMATAESAKELETILKQAHCANMPEIVFGADGIVAAATVPSADTVVTGIVGAAGLQPTIEAIKLKKDIALANKETLISGGPVINPLVEEYGVNMVSFARKGNVPFAVVVVHSCMLTPEYYASFLLTANTVLSFSVFRVFRKEACAESFSRRRVVPFATFPKASSFACVKRSLVSFKRRLRHTRTGTWEPRSHSIVQQ